MCDMDGCGTNGSKKPKPELSNKQRRAFVKGAIALPLATVLAYPDMARAAAGSTTPVSIPTPSGGMAKGVLAMPAKTPAPTVLLIHEWWGLNDQIKSMAAEFAKQGYIALAIDLYGGKVATDSGGARALMKAVDGKIATEHVKTTADWLRAHKDATGKVGSVGWCFGGGWSLNCALATPVDATVIYYGNVKKSSDQLASLKGPVLGHFATDDKWINKVMVEGFEAQMKKAGKTDLAVHWYEANHAFANPTSARYDEADAALAWKRTLAFYKKHLG